MAIVHCSECGKNISDKALNCVHCGKKLEKETESDIKTKCLECDADISDLDSCCPVCGCPKEVQKKTMFPEIQAVEVASVKVSKKTKKIAIISIFTVIALAFSVFLIKYVINIQIAKDYNSTYNTYIENLEEVQILMISGGAEAEALCDLTYSVWRNAIYEEYDSKTDPYTRPYGRFVSDFNMALTNLYEASSTITTVSNIENNQAAVKELIKILNNPPEGLEKCYETLSDLYSAYKTLTDLAISPSGNLTQFSDKKSSAVSNFVAEYEKLDNNIPEKR